MASLIQYFVSYTIQRYGALNFAAMMTARQFLSILASCYVFGHRLTLGQWCALSSCPQTALLSAVSLHLRKGVLDCPGCTPWCHC